MRLYPTERVSFWQAQPLELESQCILPPDGFTTDLQGNSILLEVGCGTGRVLSYIRRRGYIGTIVGLDLSLPALLRAYQSINEAFLIQADGLTIPLKDASVDRCIFSAFLNCFIDTAELLTLLSEAYRVLKNKGVIFISDFLLSFSLRNLSRYINGFFRYGNFGTFYSRYIFRHFSIDELKGFVETSGFLISKIDISCTRSWKGKPLKGVTILAIK